MLNSADAVTKNGDFQCSRLPAYRPHSSLVVLLRYLNQIAELGSGAPLFPTLSRQSVLDCQFSSWYPAFERHTIRARIIRPLPKSFTDFLASDGIQVPEGSEDR